ncbi:hypothetical protein Patl1_28421 [Pistacia atlantica]|uniref:Uncharacterized protein n=1 Tax=Pistacia atlantica TaxID=434234 RepID=A0ACC1BH74_9ROSI|nr:hypothetical protein Patl1_28421 [Pistacia atlantica]
MFVVMRRNLKLSPRYYGLFQENLGSYIEQSLNLPLLAADETLAPELDKVLQRRLKKKGNQARVEVLVQWKETQPEDATWEDRNKKKAP